MNPATSPRNKTIKKSSNQVTTDQRSKWGRVLGPGHTPPQFIDRGIDLSISRFSPDVPRHSARSQRIYAYNPCHTRGLPCTDKTEALPTVDRSIFYGVMIVALQEDYHVRDFLKSALYCLLCAQKNFFSLLLITCHAWNPNALQTIPSGDAESTATPHSLSLIYDSQTGSPIGFVLMLAISSCASTAGLCR